MSFKSNDEISELVRAFEACEIHPAEFKHYQHLAVALWYVMNLPYDDACDTMKAGIKRLAAAYGKMGYHETITIFWLNLVREFAYRSDGQSICSIANALGATFDKNLIRDYYSEELLESARAKSEWVEPDLKKITADGD